MPFYLERAHFEAIRALLTAGGAEADIVNLRSPGATDQYALKVKLEEGIAMWSPYESSVVWGYTVLDNDGNVIEADRKSITSGEQATAEEVAKLIVEHHGFSEDDEETEDETASA